MRDAMINKKWSVWNSNNTCISISTKIFTQNAESKITPAAESCLTELVIQRSIRFSDVGVKTTQLHSEVTEKWQGLQLRSAFLGKTKKLCKPSTTIASTGPTTPNRRGSRNMTFFYPDSLRPFCHPNPIPSVWLLILLFHELVGCFDIPLWKASFSFTSFSMSLRATLIFHFWWLFSHPNLILWLCPLWTHLANRGSWHV